MADVNLDGLDPDLPMVPVLSGPLKQVVLNMIVNAAQAIEEAAGGSDRKGLISVTTSVTNGAACIEIADTGCGMPEEVKQRIFEPFFTTKEVGRGSGQGLAIAKSIVSRPGGRMRLESEPGLGTTFTIELPLEDAPPPSEVITAPAA